MKRFLPIIAFAGLVLALATPESANADSLLRICTATGNCGICDAVTTATTLGQWLITGAAGLALVVIVFASTTLITSAGNAEKVGAAKKQILGAVVGMALVLAAFQLVMALMVALANPSDQGSFAVGSKDQQEKVGQAAGLITFLDGTAWWNICDEKDLRDKYDNKSTVPSETADCKFWGDGTPCKGDRKSICIGYREGENWVRDCKAVGSDEVTKQVERLGGEWEKLKTGVVRACDYLAVVDETYKDYECQPRIACDSDKIETGLCSRDGSDTPLVCCVKK